MPGDGSVRPSFLDCGDARCMNRAVWGNSKVLVRSAASGANAVSLSLNVKKCFANTKISFCASNVVLLFCRRTDHSVSNLSSQGHGSLMKQHRPYYHDATHPIFHVEFSTWPHNVGEMTSGGHQAERSDSETVRGRERVLGLGPSNCEISFYVYKQ